MRDDLLALEDLAEHRESRVRERHDADVGLDRGERIVGRERLGACERIEQRGLADVGEPGDTDRQCHGRRT